MPKFDVYVSQLVTCGVTLTFDAETEEEAETLAREMYRSGNLELEREGGDHGDVDCEVPPADDDAPLTQIA